MNERINMQKSYRLIGAGVLGTVLVLCGILYAVTVSVLAVLSCLLTTAVIGVWAVVLIRVLQGRLTSFTDGVCRRMDEMMRGDAPERPIPDEDTLFDRIIHRLNRLYQTVQANERLLEEQKADLQSLVSDISHQVRTPVTNLKMAIGVLLEQELSPAGQKEYLQSISTQADKLDFLMSALVKSSRLETGVITLDKKPALLYETLAAALGSIYLMAEEKRLQVTVDCPEELLLPHDSRWTSEALFNILENAVKYTPVGGMINVEVRQQEAYTEITVKDTGRGIPESRHAAVFRRFYREPEVHNIDGIGIGLYLSREIISRQGGYIKVSSLPGQGAEFRVFLPNSN